MISTFLGLETTLRALMAMQRSMETAAHNIANASTPGYSRQRVELAASSAYTIPSVLRPAAPGQLGTGVDITGIKRVREEFLDRQWREENSRLGYWEAIRDALGKVELILNEPSPNGLGAALTSFFNAWQELSKNSESLAVRTAVIEEGKTLCETIRHLYGELVALQSDLDYRLKVGVDEVNTLARQIAELNQQIARSRAVGDNPNDLLDQRDLLLDKLSKWTDFTVQEQPDGQVTVLVGNQQLVSVSGSSSIPNSWQVVNGQVVWASTNTVVGFQTGQLKGLIEVRDRDVKQVIEDLNNLASTFIAKFNQIHQQGYGLDGQTNRSFFTGTGAADITLSNDVFNTPVALAAANANVTNTNPFTVASNYYLDPTAPLNLSGTFQIKLSNSANWSSVTLAPTDSLNSIATKINSAGAGVTAAVKQNGNQYWLEITSNSQTAIQFADDPTTHVLQQLGVLLLPGDGSNALALAQLASSKTMPPSSPTGTFGDFYRGLVAEVGIASAQAVRMTDNSKLLVDQLDNRRQAVMGVSLDEEMANFMKFSHAYAAAARAMTILDEALDILINRTGLVGR
ncbi:flagellar hook-associated protein FlgK [Ammonifex degensii KC4]|uniref:Flagellar hook-associated protein 1 n=1 Tax=Ammonifex degensii (strain DSM 10501 / KC4) TaxID=429009 RepID=C9RAZ0_AMMDK|nr:flagellar hook-associated protein FlgK [Ammonifex degensii]ACX51417.1 flagellar hook-associated protein FlgK [Ammonifex degensii KC4]